MADKAERGSANLSFLTRIGKNGRLRKKYFAGHPFLTRIRKNDRL